MANTLMKLLYSLGVDSADFKRGLQDAERQADKSSKNISQSFTSAGQTMMKFGANMTAAVTLPLVLAGGAMIKAASDLEESANAVNVVFGDSNVIISEFGKTVASTTGIATADFNQMSAVMGAFLKNVGFTAAEAADETIKLTTRAADMASIFNTDVSQALAAIQSGLKGEFNPLEQFGVKINAAAIEAKALSMELADATGAINDEAKATAALALIMEQTDQFAGDFARTSDGLANSSKILKAELTNAAAALGTQLLPYALKVVQALTSLVEKFSAMSPGAQKVLIGVGVIIAAIGPLSTAIGAVSTAIGFLTSPAMAAGFTTIAGAMTSTLIPAATATGAALWTALAPILPILALIAAAALLVYLVWKNWDQLSETVKQLWFITKTLWKAGSEDIKTTTYQLMEIIKAAWRDGTNVIGQEIEMLKTTWQQLTQIVKYYWADAVQNVQAWFTSTITSIQNGIASAIGWVRALGQELMNIQIPSWMVPGSPTPLEMGLLGIGDAMRKIVSSGIPELNAGFQLPGATPAPAGAVAGETGNRTVNINIEKIDSQERVNYLAQEIGRILAT